MSNGFANINKPLGMTSQDVVGFIRRQLPKGIRIGHMGTLDPGAMGVLPLGIGKAARLFDYVVDKNKEYIAEMTLGIETDTQDSYGRIVARCDAQIRCNVLERVCQSFVGNIQQIPPAYSAVKKDGKRLYQIARKGGSVEIPARTAHIDSLQILSFSGKCALLRVSCGRGTYIRTLIHDIGKILGCGAHMSFLVRSRSGPFSIENALSPERFMKLFFQGKMPLEPMDMPIAHLPKIVLSGDREPDVRDGRALEGALSKENIARVYLLDRFAGIVIKNDGLFKWKAMLLEEER